MNKYGTKRRNYIEWDDYFMAVALLSAQRSKDPNTQVGTCIVNTKNKIVGVGYNGFPTGCSDEELPWNNHGSFLDTKYTYVCHAELNAILNSVSYTLDGCVMYTALFPCNECAKIIIQSGIGKVMYLSDKYGKTDPVMASKRMFQQAGVVYKKFKPKQKIIHISMDNFNEDNL